MRSAGPGRAHPIFLVMQPRAAFPRLIISGLRLFSKRLRPASSRLLEPVPDDVLADASATPDPTCNPRARQRSQRIWSLLASQWRTRTATPSARVAAGGWSSTADPGKCRGRDVGDAGVPILAREVGKQEGANAVPATRCCFENMRWPGFLDWRAGHAAAQPKKTGCTPASISA